MRYHKCYLDNYIFSRLRELNCRQSELMRVFISIEYTTTPYTTVKFVSLTIDEMKRIEQIKNV